MRMLSILKTSDGPNPDERRYRAALDCYLTAISGVQEQAIEVTPELLHDFQAQIRALHRSLCSNPEVEALEDSRTVLQEALEDYRKKASGAQSRKEEDLRAIVSVLGEAAQVLAGHNDRHSSRLKDFTQQLQVVGRGYDLSKMRTDLARHVQELRAVADSMWRENHLSVEQMQAQLHEFQERLERAECRASTDALTGLLNRGEGEARLRNLLQAGCLPSVILIDLNGFKQINDRWGHANGDQVLKSFSLALARNVRSGDMACRWGGDEFLVTMEADETIALERAVRWRDSLKIRHKLVVLGKIVDVQVSAAMGVAQARHGESLEDLVGRADQELYRYKKGEIPFGQESAKAVDFNGHA